MDCGSLLGLMSTSDILDIIQIIFADIVLSGDNALVIGMAAARLPSELRRRAIFIGMSLAAGLRILFGISALVHAILLAGIFITVGVFGTAKRKPQYFGALGRGRDREHH